MKSLTKRAYIRLVALFAFLSITLGVYSTVILRQNERLSLTLNAQNQRAVNELCESIDSITVDLQKCIYAGTRNMLREQGNRLCREAAAAKESLSSLTAEDSGSAGIFRFLSPTGVRLPMKKRWCSSKPYAALFRTISLCTIITLLVHASGWHRQIINAW